MKEGITMETALTLLLVAKASSCVDLKKELDKEGPPNH